MTGDDNVEKLRRSWSANADAWTNAVREQKIESRRLATDAAIVSAIVDLHPQTVLDLGCGEGWLTRALNARGLQAAGVDASAELIRAAQELGGGSFHAHSYAELANGPSILAGPFDVIAANFSLLDEQLHALLDAVRARLQPAGALIVQTVHPAFAGGDYVDGWRVETFASMDGEWREPMPWYFRTIASWTRAFADRGYVVANIQEPLHPHEPRPLSVVFICRVDRTMPAEER